MQRLPLVIAALFSLLLLPPLGPPTGSRLPGRLMTRWAKDVSPENALPEYPRPQMVRKDWLNLNGLWDIKLADGTEAKILVPYPIESALSGVMKHADRMTYRRSFEIPQAWSGRHVLLHFGAVDWEAKVSVNGKELGVHRGGYDDFSFDITDALKTSGEQEIAVEVFDPTDAGSQPRGKQVLHPGGIMYTPTSGIWQTVWLEPVAETHIESLLLVPDVDAGCLRLTVGGTGTVEAVASDGGRQVAQVSGDAGAELKLAIPDPKLWSPDSPHLYDLRVSLKSGGKTVDEVTSYFGMRKIALGKDEQGVTRLMLNGKFVFQVGPLDQGFWPDGIYTAPTDEALRWDIETMKKLGFNCARKHVKVEPDRWYYWCDKLGLLVWQDMPAGDNKTAEAKQQFEVELRRLIEGRRDHPAIIMWVVFNEGWGQYDTQRLDQVGQGNGPQPAGQQRQRLDRQEVRRRDRHAQLSRSRLAQAGRESRGGAGRVRRPGPRRGWPHLEQADLGLQRHARLRGPDPQLRKTARQGLGVEGQGRAFRLHLHAAHRRGDRVQRVVDLRPRGEQGDPGRAAAANTGKAAGGP